MDQKQIEGRSEAGDRRDFLKKAGKLAVAVPAVALLLSANATPAQAAGRYGKQGRRGKAHKHHGKGKRK